MISGEGESQMSTQIEAEDCAIVFRPDGSIDLLVPGRDDHIVPEYCLAASEMFFRAHDESIGELAAAFMERKPE